MKKFLNRCLIFLLVIIIINTALRVLVPYYWGNTGFASKVSYYQENKASYNTLFFGSSRTYRQVDAGLLDQILMDSGFNASTFNMGAQATFNPQVYYLYENFLEEDATGVETVFMELMEVDEIPEQILHTTRNKYWIDISYYWFSLQHFFNVREWDEIWNYTVTFFENFFNANQVMEIINSLGGVDVEDKYLGQAQDGFLPIDEEVRRFSGTEEARDLELRHERFKEQAENLENRRKDLISAFDVTKDYPYISQVHLNKLDALIRNSEAKGIRLIFFIADTKANKRLIATWLNLPEANRIELISPETSSYNFNSELRWDLGHLNEKGAILFTRQLADKYVRISDK
ncbi:hypothetical protein AB9P05_17610 [Roseivirga sp. BDSF3-8]|uniref:hypothetical protein n=1 Tax=Roseivirga sp. BDSF3-8 TaxID=3241598 RepID=UPI0035322483